VKQLAESNEQCCLANILKIFEGYLTSVDEPINDDVYGHRNPNYQSQKLYKHLDDKNFDSVIPPPDTAVLLKLMVEGLHNLSNKFNDLNTDLTNTEFKMNIMNAQHTNTIINILSNCLHLCNDEINIQTILNTFQNIFLAGEIDNSKFRSTIINAMGKHAVPVPYEKCSLKNILVIKCKLNISH
jgi:hypothetical protein